ncbi:MAG: OmpA family protein [Lentisphaerae bacterium]|nr:OmpA family protein [Lentisphaerota bacterium]
MKHHAWLVNVVSAMIGIVATIGVANSALAQEPAQETGAIHPWYLGVSSGMLDFQGDQSVSDSIGMFVGLGYDYSDRWTFEGKLQLAPSLDVTRTDGTSFNTYGAGLSFDGLFHFTRWERLDPYMAAGIGFVHYGESVNDAQTEMQLRVGGGVMYHFNDQWAIHADYRAMLQGFGQAPNANSIANVGICWTWAARLEEKIVAVGGSDDADGDGLTDAEELEWGTDVYDPDTDRDGLQDGQEVHAHKTDPLNPDTDWDGLTDGAEVLVYDTHPLRRDTDEGGVADGHEVIEDGTDPLDKSDDLQLFELNIQFALKKSDINPEYDQALLKIAKAMQRNPESVARIEGHADKTRRSGDSYNKRLSQRRAESVKKWLMDKGGISADRLTAVGYGFDRPKAPNDRETGNPVNRRVEIYIRSHAAQESNVEQRHPVKGVPSVVEDIK